MEILISIFFISVLCGRGGSLVLLHKTASLQLPYDYPVATTFYRLQAVEEKHGIPTTDTPNYHIVRSVEFPNRSKFARGLFVIDEHTGSLMLAPHRRHSIAEFIGSTFALDIVAVPSQNVSEQSSHATIVVTIAADNFTLPDCSPREELCFSSPEIHYQIPETVLSGTDLGNLRPIPYAKLCPDSSVKYSLDYDDSIPIKTENGRLKTKSLFDFEESAYHELNISCEVQNENETATFYSRVRVYVLDVDDNPPYIQDGTKTFKELHVSQILPGKELQFSILDPDSPAVNKITVEKKDPLNLFMLRDPVIFHPVKGKRMLMSTALVPKSQFTFPDTTYNITVIFNDSSLIGAHDTSQVVFHVIISNSSSGFQRSVLPLKEFEAQATIFRHSAQMTRVAQPMEVLPHEGYFFRIVRDSNQGLLDHFIFGVTPKTGIVYVMDEAELARSTVKLFSLELAWRNRNVTDRRCVVTIRVLDSDDPSHECGISKGRKFPSCAIHGSAESCTSSCGRGANGGFCHWRSHSTRPVKTLVEDYATCSPHLRTCPDGTCDELEEMDPLLCPQDCTDTVVGEALPRASGRGVWKSAAPCTCFGRNSCTCLQFFPPSKLVSRSQTKVFKDTPIIKYQPPYASENWGGCGGQCVTMIVVVVLIVSGLIVVTGVLTYRRWMSHSKSEELPSVRTPLNSSTYLVARRTTDYPLQQRVFQQVNLQFRRDHLTLEETLGEGEFGKVVKGKAINIAGLPGTTTVAVKMLKDESSASERRDLISELNLLKEISHPNVIRLLAASTDDDGPLYIIMEYAEHGSLITYLRNMKSNCSETNMPELIAFALQVAKGMEYLASMKVVHRDLAARNVLVATGKILKISDFGLSRDVYEGDTYLKMSKGKVPVKWMALESLENQIYTTKSDVWSFGILLWEIITIGGCPYPGIPTERLFQLLKEGYRMPTPDNCPIQLYEIMKICWLDRPNERPHFKELVQKIELILEEISHQPTSREENAQKRSKRLGSRDEGSVLQQLTSFPRLAVQEFGPYENQCLLSSNEFSV